MADGKIDYNALAQALDTSWGRSSTPKTAGYSVKFMLQGDRVIASYAAIVNFGSEKEMILMKRAYAEESIAIINEVMKAVKANYKKLADKVLTTKEVTASDTIEIIGFGVHNPKRTAYYRKKVVFDVS